MKLKFVWGSVLAASAASLSLLIACGGTETVVETVVVERVVEVVQTVEVERVVEVEKVVEVEVTAAAEEAMTGDQIPRERQLILLWGGSGGVGSAGQYTNHDIWNVYSGVSHQDGPALIFEPLAFYSAFNDTE